MDQLEETGDFFGTGRTKLARGCSRLNPSLTDRLELTFLNDASPKRGVLSRATMDPAKEFLLSKDISLFVSIRSDRKGKFSFFGDSRNIYFVFIFLYDTINSTFYIIRIMKNRSFNDNSIITIYNKNLRFLQII